METTPTYIEIRKDLRAKADTAVEQGRFTGINNLRALIEYALEQLLKTVEEGTA